MKKPQRAFTLEITIGGDTWEDVLQDLRHIANMNVPPVCETVVGGPSVGHTMKGTYNPEMTHDRYIKELNEYLEQIREKPHEEAQ